ncbi:hypothetical protein [Sanguibacter inulinus]|uniref:Uncharacterized protein n=1 Tax=Sanguibacter inulinus TaxID=60922 RepID=A0A853ESM8_9MICO|nr:hypothetical protein [Sanguibacter inulinus]MBF0722356.1 hypothetical protein [Sanguibacter inulinus]NYS93501.1 hypothetical protein [Sanguibacter inulinus]
MDYSNFFDLLGRQNGQTSAIELSPDYSVVIERAEFVDGVWRFRLVSGDPSEDPLFYSERTGRTEIADLGEGRWVATRTRFVVDPERRLLMLEVRRGGVGVVSLERYFRRVAARLGIAENLQFDLNPLPSPSFSREIDRFTRIREASLIVRRPNNDWDDAGDVLSGLADNSGGKKAVVAVQAARGDSLRKGRGIVNLIREHLQRPLSNVEDAKITGTQEGASVESTVSLSRHQLQLKVQVPRDPRGTSGELEVFDAAEALLTEASLLRIPADESVDK